MDGCYCLNGNLLIQIVLCKMYLIVEGGGGRTALCEEVNHQMIRRDQHFLASHRLPEA